MADAKTPRFGGIFLPEIAHRRGIAGTVIDGVNRDVHLCLSLGYPVFSKDHWIAHREGPSAGGRRERAGDDRWRSRCAGDLLKGDADGVVVLSAIKEEEVLAAAEEIRDAEERIRVSCQAGMSLSEARAKNRYHDLQKRQEPKG
ncbi:MAG: hypothetical protein WDN76_11800 [Alphaproteobacteria bacterium]